MTPPPLDLVQLTVGPLSEHCYVVIDPATDRCVVVDPGAEAERVVAAIGQRRVTAILLTHAHHDHIGAVNDVRAATGARVWIHPADAHMLGAVRADEWLGDEQRIKLGAHALRAQHTPGHTPGMISLHLDGDRVLVGDTIFDGGPGRTWSPDDFRTTLATLRDVVLRWPDTTVCYPGHGPSFRLGERRGSVERFLAQPHGDDFFGDTSWPSDDE